MFILYENEPYFYDAENDKVYACDITPDGVSCNFKNSMKAPKEINCGYTHGEISALLADRIATAEPIEVKPKGKKAKASIDDE